MSQPVALVTGATEGIGRAIAFALGRAGYAVGVCARTPSKLRLLLDDLTAAGIRAVGQPGDVGLEAAARKQGFRSLADVDQAILYPGGTFCFIGRVPTADAIHHHQLMRELHLLRQEVEALRTAPGR